MPLRSLNSSVFKWPDRTVVDQAVRCWTKSAIKQHPELVRLGYFGSYARGDWGVGSDLDLLAIVNQTSEPFEQRAKSWPLEELPVPAEMLVYTVVEWQRLLKEGNRFALTSKRETVWVWDAEHCPAGCAACCV